MNKLTVPSYLKVKTSDKNIFRYVDRKGDWTHYWLKKEKVFLPAVNHVMKHGYSKGERFMKYLLDTTREKAEKVLKQTGEEGTRTHDAIRRIIDGQKINLQTLFYNETLDKHDHLTNGEQDNLAAFILWAETYKPQVVVHEYAVCSVVDGYAGTLDFFGTILVPEKDKNFAPDLWGKRVLIILDWKTSAGIYDDQPIQVSAYWKALIRNYKGVIALAEKYGDIHTGIIRLGSQHKTGYEMQTWDGEETEGNFKIFLSAMEIYKNKTGGNIPEAVLLPAEFSFAVPRIKVSKKNPKIKPVITQKKLAIKYKSNGK